MPSVSRDEQMEAYLRSVRSRFEDTLGQIVEVPSVSMDPERAPDMRRAATLAVQLLKDLGAEAQVIDTAGHPIVTGAFTVGTDCPTVTVYNHLDVQPAQEPEWRQSPFAFKNEEGIYRGRGATDDKGPALSALLGARYALDQGVRVNIRFLWELEEEIGSPNFAEALRDKQAFPKPDSVVVSDTIWISKSQPAMAYGLRGLLAVKLSLRTGTVGVHSGLTGGAARNPLTELCDLAHACVDARTGKVKIPGFYDDVIRPTKAEIAGFLKSGFHVKNFMKAYGFESLRTTDPEEIVRRIWASPTFEVHGMSGGYQGPGVKTIVPAQGELKVSMRLVPEQRPAKVFRLFKQFVAKRNPNVRVESCGMLEPYRGVVEGPYAEAARRAVRSAFGKDPALIREGGSIGAVVSMQRAWKAPIIFLGLSLPEHGYHAPNEFFDWGQASGGMKAFAQYFEELAKIGR
jgi:acetylornithine deacetylase/succinyl-diaminopimelate desuccinylase-like protein